MDNKLIYQTVAYAPDNQNPTEDHILQATFNALRTPSTQKFHMRMWFPHRARLTNKVWKWVRDNTHFNMNLGMMQNCKHIAMWVMVPESKEVHEANKDAMDKPLPDSCFVNEQGECDWWSDRAQMERSKRSINLDYYQFIYTQGYEYARSMREMDYDVGFAGCISTKPNSFNRTFGEHFKGQVVIPIMMVYAGTKGKIVQHTPTRDNIKKENMGGEIVGLPNFKVEPFDRISPTVTLTQLPHFKKIDNELIRLSRDEVLQSGVCKHNVGTKQNILD